MKQNNKNILPILGALAVSFAPLVLRLPLWIVIWCVVLWAYVILSIFLKWPWPNLFFRRILTIIGLLGIMQTFRHAIGGPAFIGILSVMAGLKPLEINNHRDRMVTIFLAYFLIITGLFEYETLAITIYMFFSVLINTTALIHINRPDGQLRDNFSLSGRILVQALPIMVVLFFLFPRLQGSFWRLSRQPVGRTGFTENLSLGDVANLVVDDKVAFRAEFKNAIPEPDLLYWRGIVFWDFNGNSWDTRFKAPVRRAILNGKNPVEYSITLEPHFKKWIFALDLPVVAPYPAYMLDDYTLLLKRNLKKKLRYQVKSYTSFNTGGLRNREGAALKLPGKGNEKARTLARKWKVEADSPEEIIEKALAFFRENNFIYTLKPHILRKNPIDQFLFYTQKGFCEHYASAFAFLMRAAGIPSRIVGGYVGGKVNPYGNYLIVNQSDAHVWVEIWIEKKGWIRVDPTSAVAPARIAQGIREALSAEELPAFLASGQRGLILDLWEKIGLGWDALSTKWDMLFTGYSYLEQKAMLSYLGINVRNKAGWIIFFIVICLVILLIVILFLRHIYKPAVKKDIVQAIYMKLCTKLAKIGLKRNPSQGPSDYAQLIGASNQNLKTRVYEIIDLYILLRYGKGGDANTLKRFKLLVKNLHLNLA